MPIEFTVVGEHKDDETQLLVIGADGLYYSYQPAAEELSPIELDDSWNVYASQGGESPDLDSDQLELL